MKYNITVLLAGLALVLTATASLAAGDAASGQTKAQVCASCHGATGVSLTPAFPTLAGQYPDYIVRALADYKSGKRSNPVMTSFAAGLSKQDMWDLAAWFGSQSGLAAPNIAKSQ